MTEWLSYAPADFLMFSARTYWRLFELENAALMPLPVLAPVAGLAAILVAHRRPGAGVRVLAALLALGWAWVGWSFVGQRYAPINPAAGHAVPLFFVQALLLGWLAVAGAAAAAGRARRIAGQGLLVYAVLLHPLAAPLGGRPLAGAEIVGIAPDPTAMATLGLALMLASPATRVLTPAIPAIWLAASALTLGVMGAAESAIPALALAVALGTAVLAPLGR